MVCTPSEIIMKQQRIGIRATSSVTDSSHGDANNKERLTVKYPTDGWSTSLEKMPMFTRAEMNEHIARKSWILQPYLSLAAQSSDLPGI